MSNRRRISSRHPVTLALDQATRPGIYRGNGQNVSFPKSPLSRHISASELDLSRPSLAARLVTQLKLESCTVAGSSTTAVMETGSLGRSKFGCLDCRNQLKLRARSGVSTQILWLTIEGDVRFQLRYSVVYCSQGAACLWPASSEVRVIAEAGHSAFIVGIDSILLKQELSRLLGRPALKQLVFEPWLKIGRGNTFGDLLRLVRTDLDREPSTIIHSKIFAAACETLLIDALLVTQTNNHSTSLDGQKGDVVPRHLKAVIIAIQAEPKRDWRLAEMAKVSDVSVRTLCASFNRFRGCSPKQFLQMVRLTGARKQLIAQDAQVSIGMVARQWGFSHPGRFAATYHKVFGEAPSDTVRRLETLG
jgi:AraC-like DNA-binding protein